MARGGVWGGRPPEASTAGGSGGVVPPRQAQRLLSLPETAAVAAVAVVSLGPDAQPGVLELRRKG